MASPETRERQRTMQAVQGEGWYVFTLHGSPFSGRGRSDLIVCAAGQFIAVEMKVGKGVPTPIQIERIYKVRAAGGCAFVGREAHSVVRAIHAHLEGRRIYMPESTELDFSFLDTLLDAPPQPEPAPQPEPEPMMPAYKILTDAASEPEAAPWKRRDGTPEPIPFPEFDGSAMELTKLPPAVDGEPATMDTILLAIRQTNALLEGLISVISTLRTDAAPKRTRTPKPPAA